MSLFTNHFISISETPVLVPYEPYENMILSGRRQSGEEVELQDTESNTRLESLINSKLWGLQLKS